MGDPYDTSSERTSVLGPTLRFKGELHADEELLIRGQIEGSITHSQRITVCGEGIVKANIRAQTIVVEGTRRGRPAGREVGADQGYRPPQGQRTSPERQHHRRRAIQRRRHHGYRKARCWTQHQHRPGRQVRSRGQIAAGLPARGTRTCPYSTIRLIAYPRLRSVGPRLRPNRAPCRAQLRTARRMLRPPPRTPSVRSPSWARPSFSRASSPLTKTSSCRAASRARSITPRASPSGSTALSSAIRMLAASSLRAP